MTPGWPVSAAMLPFSAAPRDRWAHDLGDVAAAGFERVDLTDSWVRAGDLSAAERQELKLELSAAGLSSRSMSVIRASVIDHRSGDQNLEYSHRALEAAADLGLAVVSFGLHQPLTDEQRAQLWFWTVRGHVDADDPETRALAVSRFRELGQHAQDLGLLVSLELYEDTLLGTGASAVRLVEEIGLSNVGLNADVGNLIRLHRPVEHWLTLYETVLPYTNFWHLKSYSRDEDPERGWYTAVPTTLELGIIDHRRVMDAAAAAGFDGHICLEHYGGDGLSVCATNRRYLQDQVFPRVHGERGHSGVQQQTERVRPEGRTA